MAKKRKKKQIRKQPFDRATYAKLESVIFEAQEALFAKKLDEAISLCQRVTTHRKATARQKSEAYACIAAVHMQTQDFSLAANALTAAIPYTPNDWVHFYNRSAAMLYTSRVAQSLKDIERAALLCDDATMHEKIAEQTQTVRNLAAEECASRGDDFTVDALLEQQSLFHDGFQALAAKDWETAETKLTQSIAMADVLPQPWFNLGSIYAQRKEWDSAEKAWRRALEIDPDYQFAKHNLEKLPELRAGKQFSEYSNVEPFKGQIDNLNITKITR